MTTAASHRETETTRASDEDMYDPSLINACITASASLMGFSTPRLLEEFVKACTLPGGGLTVQEGHGRTALQLVQGWMSQKTSKNRSSGFDTWQSMVITPWTEVVQPMPSITLSPSARAWSGGTGVYTFQPGELFSWEQRFLASEKLGTAANALNAIFKLTKYEHWRSVFHSLCPGVEFQDDGAANVSSVVDAIQSLRTRAIDWHTRAKSEMHGKALVGSQFDNYDPEKLHEYMISLIRMLGQSMANTAIPPLPTTVLGLLNSGNLSVSPTPSPDILHWSAVWIMYLDKSPPAQHELEPAKLAAWARKASQRAIVVTEDLHISNQFQKTENVGIQALKAFSFGEPSSSTLTALQRTTQMVAEWARSIQPARSRLDANSNISSIYNAVKLTLDDCESTLSKLNWEDMQNSEFAILAREFSYAVARNDGAVAMELVRKMRAHDGQAWVTRVQEGVAKAVAVLYRPDGEEDDEAPVFGTFLATYERACTASKDKGAAALLAPPYVDAYKKLHNMFVSGLPIPAETLEHYQWVTDAVSASTDHIVQEEFLTHADGMLAAMDRQEEADTAAQTEEIYAILNDNTMHKISDPELQHKVERSIAKLDDVKEQLPSFAVNALTLLQTAYVKMQALREIVANKAQIPSRIQNLLEAALSAKQSENDVARAEIVSGLIRDTAAIADGLPDEAYLDQYKALVQAKLSSLAINGQQEDLRMAVVAKVDGFALTEEEPLTLEKLYRLTMHVEELKDSIYPVRVMVNIRTGGLTPAQLALDTSWKLRGLQGNSKTTNQEFVGIRFPPQCGPLQLQIPQTGMTSKFFSVQTNGSRLAHYVDSDMEILKADMLGRLGAKSTNPPRHHVYSATGVSGSGKTYALLSAPRSLKASVLDTIIAHLKALMQTKQYDLYVRLADLYGEIVDNDKDCEGPDGIDANLRTGKLYLFNPDTLQGIVPTDEVSADAIILRDSGGDGFVPLAKPQSLTKMAMNLMDVKSRVNFGQDQKHQFHIRETPNNRESSRAHTVLTIKVCQAGDSKKVTMGKISLLDMAGTENVDTIQKTYFDSVLVKSRKVSVNRTGTQTDAEAVAAAFQSGPTKQQLTLAFTVDKLAAALEIATISEHHEEKPVAKPEAWARLLLSSSPFLRKEVDLVLGCPPALPIVSQLVNNRIQYALEIEQWLSVIKHPENYPWIDYATNLNDTSSNMFVRTWLDELKPHSKSDIKKIQREVAELKKPSEKYPRGWMDKFVYKGRFMLPRDTFVAQLTVLATQRVANLRFQDDQDRRDLVSHVVSFSTDSQRLENKFKHTPGMEAVAEKLQAIHARVQGLMDKLVPDSSVPEIPPHADLTYYGAPLAEQVRVQDRGKFMNRMRPYLSGESARIAPQEKLTEQLEKVASTTLAAGGRMHDVAAAVAEAENLYHLSEDAKKRIHCPLRRQGNFIEASIKHIRNFVESIVAKEVKGIGKIEAAPWISNMLAGSGDKFRFIQIAALRSDFPWDCAAARNEDSERQDRVREGAVDTLVFAHNISSLMDQV